MELIRIQSTRINLNNLIYNHFVFTKCLRLCLVFQCLVLLNEMKQLPGRKKAKGRKLGRKKKNKDKR
jgi:hypothetical protein